MDIFDLESLLQFKKCMGKEEAAQRKVTLPDTLKDVKTHHTTPHPVPVHPYCASCDLIGQSLSAVVNILFRYLAINVFTTNHCFLQHDASTPFIVIPTPTS